MGKRLNKFEPLMRFLTMQSFGLDRGPRSPDSPSLAWSRSPSSEFLRSDAFLELPKPKRQSGRVSRSSPRCPCIKSACGMWMRLSGGAALGLGQTEEHGNLLCVHLPTRIQSHLTCPSDRGPSPADLDSFVLLNILITFSLSSRSSIRNQARFHLHNFPIR